MTLLLPATIALGSACGFAVSTSLQHRAVTHAPAGVTNTMQTLRWVVTRPWWIAGAFVGAVALGLHALALRLGAISIVQPIMISGVVLAVLVRAFLDWRMPSGPELRAVIVTTVGLGAFLVASDPPPGPAPPETHVAAIMTLGGMLVATAVFAASVWLTRGGSRAMALGAAAGILFGVNAGLLKLIAGSIGSGSIPENALTILGAWPPWALVAVGGFAIAINQRAYQMASLSMSMPVLNIVDVLVALTFGWFVFGEAAANDTNAVVVQVVALACIAWGLRLLSLTWDGESHGTMTKGSSG